MILRLHRISADKFIVTTTISITKEYNKLQGSVGKNHIHLLLSCLSRIAPSKIMQYLKGRSSGLLQGEFPKLKKGYWGQYLWARDYFCATVGNVKKLY